MTGRPSSDRPMLAAASSRADLLGAFRGAMSPYGFTASAIGFAPGASGTISREPFLLLDWPREWLELYARMGFAADDIVVREAQRTRGAFTWARVQRDHPGASAAIFEAARGFGWHDGFVVPVHDLHGPEAERFGIVSLAASRRLAFDGDTARHVVRLCLVAFARARALRGRETSAAAEFKLTRREREVLALVAEGKSDNEIGIVLGLKTATAHFHIEQAKRRLAASTRAQAVAIAVKNGFI